MSDQALRDFALRHQLSPVALGELYALVEAQQGRGSSHASTLMFEADETMSVEGGAVGEERVVALPERSGERYTRLERIGEGATSEVWRVRDHDLKRDMAMKVLDPQLRRAGPKGLSRFLAEAQVTAQLQHPSILPVHEIGTLDDGTVYFTMEEVDGQTLDAVAATVHQASQEVWSTTESGWSLRRLVEAFRRVCEAVAYAHSRGVVHRDLKPANVMVGAFGEVRVMDWGLARLLADEPDGSLADGGGGDGPDAVDTLRTDDALATRAGTIAGTPAFMSPEQAAGDVDLVDRRSDVWSLGALLYFLLTCRAPYEGPAVRVLYRLVYAEPDPLVGRPDGPLLPTPLVRIVERAMQRHPDDRYDDAGAMVAEVTAWLDGAERRAAALQAVGAAAEARRAAGKLRRRARATRSAAEATLAALPAEAPDAARHAAWAEEDAAAVLERQAMAYEWVMERELTAAFAHEPGLPEAHVALARETRRLHQEAEAQGDHAQALRLEGQLRHHVDALAPEWPGRARLVRYLEGKGSLTLDVPEGVELELTTLVLRHRRLVRGPVHDVAVPLEAHLLPMGSYLATLRTASATHVYPVHVARLGHWAGEVEGLPELPEGTVWVPGGPWLRGPAREESWLDGFAIGAHPITRRAWRAWQEAEGVPAAERGVGGDDLPVVGVSVDEVERYIAWRSARDGVAWQLPTEEMWEKAARGVDGRAHPMGPCLEPAWANLWRASGAAQVEPVSSRPADGSVYGMMGATGNVSEWTATRVGPLHRVICGGSFLHEPPVQSTTLRRPLPAAARWPHVGFRLALPLP